MIDRVVLEQVARYTVHGFEEFLDACCVVRVYPADDDLPYEAISYLTLTAREPENRSTIGFQTQWIGKKQS